jgi:hypothetical protein
MEHFIAYVVLCGLAVGHISVANAQSEHVAGTPSSLGSEPTSGDLPALPPPPKGKSTIVGGEIQNIDPILDQITLKVLGQRPVKILFDERTEVYRDGARISLRDLISHDHASVETVLSGTAVFALSIHMLTQPPEGECQGQVLKYDPDTGELTVTPSLSREPIKLLVPRGAVIAREGQAAFSSVASGPSDLVKGSVISIKFRPDKDGRGVASQIAVLAVPGSSFVLRGNLTSLDLHAGILVLIDPQDDKSYRVFFDSVRLPASRTLQLGGLVTATSSFDGVRYVANAITAN